MGNDRERLKIADKTRDRQNKKPLTDKNWIGNLNQCKIFWQWIWFQLSIYAMNKKMKTIFNHSLGFLFTFDLIEKNGTSRTW